MADYADFVSKYVRNQLNDEQVTILREDPHRLREQLIILKRDIELQLSTRSADLLDYKQDCYERKGGKADYFDEKAVHDKWRAGALRWKLGIEQKLLETKRLIREQAPKQDPRENRGDYSLGTAASLLEQILGEVRQIREKLQ